MHTPISSMMQSPVWSIGMDDTAQAAQALMSEHGLSWLPVLGADGQPVGVIALHDLTQFYARGGDPGVVPVWQICHYKPISVAADTSILEVAGLMLAHKIHHVVVTQHGTLVGVVSALDFVRRFADQAG
jgi:CBS domain-containing protein